MTYTADDYRKAADVIESVYPRDNTAPGLRIRADRLDAEAAEQAKLDEQVEGLAERLSRAGADYPKHFARIILTDGRWKRVSDE